MSTQPFQPGPPRPPMQQQRKPAKRAFTARLAGSPLAVAVSAPTPEPKKKRGRRPIGDHAMTSAERKALERRRKHNNEADQAKRDLVAKLMHRYRSMQPNQDPDATSLMPRRAWLRQVKTQLLSCDIEQLRTLLETWKKHHDHKGRLHNERSGEGPQLHGQSEIERLIAIRGEHDGSVRHAMEHSSETGDGSAETLDRKAPPARLSAEQLKRLETQEDCVTYMLHKYFVQDGDSGACTLCNETVASSDARQHFWLKIAEGLKGQAKTGHAGSLQNRP